MDNGQGEPNVSQEGAPAFALHAVNTASVAAYQCHGSNVGEMGTLLGGNGNETGGVPFVFDTTQVTSKGNYSNPKPGDPCHPLASGQHPPAVAAPLTECYGKTLDHAGSKGSGPENAIVSGMAVRRLTPREAERLQGFSDDYTLIPYRGKPAADGPRYRALGNSMAVPCMVWIGRRIQMCEEAIKPREESA
jgi:DNA (cytosine-5)-methyltransferase 1